MRTLILIIVQFALVAKSSQQVSRDKSLLDALALVLNPTELLDGPSSISNAPSSTNTKRPTPEQLSYYVYFAASSYCSNQLQDLSCVFCNHFNADVSHVKVITNDTTDNLAFIVVQPLRKEIVVTFRGSYNLANNIQDIELLQIHEALNIRIHSGFVQAALSLYNKVVADLKTQLKVNPGFSVVIVGHSLGAAMSSITQFLLTFQNRFPEVEYTLVTFGQPRTGNKDYADYMNNLTISMARVTNRADLVPHIPPVSLLILNENFLHHQTEYWVELNGNAEYCSNLMYEDPNCSSSVGPVYSHLNHFHYLGLNMATCFIQDPLQVLVLPDIIDILKLHL